MVLQQMVNRDHAVFYLQKIVIIDAILSGYKLLHIGGLLLPGCFSRFPTKKDKKDVSEGL